MSESAAAIWRDLDRGCTVASPEAMANLGEKVALALPPNRWITLSGDLGTGKTTFAQGMARAWNIREPVTSPTFNLLLLYQGDRQLVHLDAYRLNTTSDLDGLFLDEILRPPWNGVLEWPEKVRPLPFDPACALEFSHEGEQARRVDMR